MDGWMDGWVGWWVGWVVCWLTGLSLDYVTNCYTKTTLTGYSKTTQFCCGRTDEIVPLVVLTR